MDQQPRRRVSSPSKMKKFFLQVQTKVELGIRSMYGCYENIHGMIKLILLLQASVGSFKDGGTHRQTHKQTSDLIVCPKKGRLIFVIIAQPLKVQCSNKFFSSKN